MNRRTVFNWGAIGALTPGALTSLLVGREEQEVASASELPRVEEAKPRPIPNGLVPRWLFYKLADRDGIQKHQPDPLHTQRLNNLRRVRIISAPVSEIPGTMVCYVTCISRDIPSEPNTSTIVRIFYGMEESFLPEIVRLACTGAASSRAFTIQTSFGSPTPFGQKVPHIRSEQFSKPEESCPGLQLRTPMDNLHQLCNAIRFIQGI